MDSLKSLEEVLEQAYAHHPTHGLGRAIRGLKKEISLYQKYLAHRDSARSKWSGKPVERLQIGSGLHKLDGWINLDLGVDADVCWDIREGLPFGDNSVGCIFSEHTLEHIDYPVSVKLLYREMFRVLRPGGQIVIGVPDGGLAMQSYAKKDRGYFDLILQRWYKNRKTLAHFNTYSDLVNYIFRDEDDDDTYTPHMWAYDEEKLVQLANEAGFINIHKWKFDPTIANPKREWGSIYVASNKPDKE